MKKKKKKRNKNRRQMQMKMMWWWYSRERMGHGSLKKKHPWSQIWEKTTWKVKRMTTTTTTRNERSVPFVDSRFPFRLYIGRDQGKRNEIKIKNQNKEIDKKKIRKKNKNTHQTKNQQQPTPARWEKKKKTYKKDDSWRTMVSNDIKVQWNACPLLVSSFFLSFFHVPVLVLIYAQSP